MSEPLYTGVDGQKIYESTKWVLKLQSDDIDAGDFSSFYLRAVQQHQSSFGLLNVS